MSADQLTHWWARGVGGLLRMLERWLRDGEAGSPRLMVELEAIEDRAANLQRLARGEPLKEERHHLTYL